MSQLDGDQTERPQNDLSDGSDELAPEQGAADALGAADSDEALSTGPDDESKAPRGAQ